MKFFYLSIVLMTASCGVNSLMAQVTIGSAVAPSKGAILDLKQYDDAEAKAGGRTANKGLGMPRVKLTDLNSLSDIAGADLSDPEKYAGLLVYNTHELPKSQGTCSRTTSAPGLFVWDGNAWHALSDSETQMGEEVTDNIKYSGVSADGLSWYILNDGTLNICGFGPMTDYDTSVSPGIKPPWLAYQSEIKSIIIQDGVESVGDMAFGNIYGNQKISIGNSVKSIGKWAFTYQAVTGELVIPNSVVSIGFGAFLGCTGVTSFVIGDSVERIEEQAFYSCFGMEKLYLGKSLKFVGRSCFTHCSKLTSFTLPDSLEELDYGAFGALNNISTLIIPSSVRKLGGSSLSGFGGTTIYSYCPISAYPEVTSDPAYNYQVFSSATNSPTMYVPAEYYEAYKIRVSDYWTPQTITLSDVPAPPAP